MHLNLNDKTMTFTSWLTPDAQGMKGPTKSTGSGWCFFAYPTGFLHPSKNMYQ